MPDVSALNLRGRLAKAVPVGPARADDTALTVTGTVLDWDPTGRVRVSLRGGDVWLPAVAGRYSQSSLARVLLDPTNARPVMVLGPVVPRKPAELATVTATGTGTVTIKLLGVSYTVPASGSYTVGQSAWVLLDDWGVPMLGLFPDPTPLPGAVVVPPPPPPPATVSATVTISPQTSGTWRTSAGRWDQWNTTKYGGAADIYQGNGYGSGLLIGFAGYGDQIVNLGAVSIDAITLVARKDADGNSAVLTVQGSPSGTRPGGAPSSSGDTPSSGSIPSGGWGSLAFTGPMLSAFASGAAKGLVAVGGQYGGFGGTSTPGSFALQIRYTKNA